MIKAVLFDMDGVLIDSLEVWHSSLNNTLKNFGKNGISLEEFYKRVINGTTASKDIKELFGELPKERFDGIKNFYYSQFISSIKKIRINHEAIRVLKGLEKNKKLGLVTNSSELILSNLFQHFDFHKYFGSIVNSSMALPKPNPDMLLLACKNLGINTGEAIYVGDTLVDVETAKRAGIRIVFYSQESNQEADFNIKNLSEILEIANGNL